MAGEEKVFSTCKSGTKMKKFVTITDLADSSFPYNMGMRKNNLDETVEKGINRTLSMPALSKVEVSKRPVPRSNSGPSASSTSEFACFSTVSSVFFSTILNRPQAL